MPTGVVAADAELVELAELFELAELLELELQAATSMTAATAAAAAVMARRGTQLPAPVRLRSVMEPPWGSLRVCGARRCGLREWTL